MNYRIASKTRIFILLLVITALVFASLDYSAGFASAQIAPNMEDISDPSPKMQDSIEVINPYYSIRHTTAKDGTLLSAHIIGGPPNPPAEFAAERAASIPAAVDATILPNFPSYNWVFGCSAVSAAMIAGYYDRGAYPNMYTGPANGGVMPISDTSWPTWRDGYNVEYPNNPLIASRNGVDGRSTRGSIDDYWISYNSALTDPYITKGWTPHTWGTAVGDYMKTSQSAYGNTDGSTAFYTFTSSSNKLTCSDMLGYNIASEDGTYGRKLFYEARGYKITDCYNQATDNKITGGFSLANFQAEINAGHPVLLNLDGHSIVGYGYNGSTIYIRDTWDNVPSNLYTMPWGGSYDDMQLQGVSVVHVDSMHRVFLPTVIRPVPSSNHSPTGMALSNSTILENQAVNTVVGAFSTIDPDAGNTFVYSLVSGAGDTDNVAFNIAADQLRSSQTFDYETKSSYSIRVRTTDQGGLFYEKAFSVTVSDIFEGASIVNGDFEQGQTGWAEYSTHSFVIIMQEYASTPPAHSGDWLAWLGGFSDENSSITQSVLVPSASSYLRFWYWIDSDDDCGNAFFWIKVNGVAVQTTQLCTTQNTGGWVQGSVDLSAYAGTTILLKFDVLTDVDLIGSVFLDDIVFASSAAALPQMSLPDVSPTELRMKKD